MLSRWFVSQTIGVLLSDAESGSFSTKMIS